MRPILFAICIGLEGGSYFICCLHRFGGWILFYMLFAQVWRVDPILYSTYIRLFGVWILFHILFTKVCLEGGSHLYLGLEGGTYFISTYIAVEGGSYLICYLIDLEGGSFLIYFVHSFGGWILVYILFT